MIPSIPSTAAIFSAIAAKIPAAVTSKLQRAVTLAMEAAAILAPLINGGVSWRTINESAFNTINVLSSEGLLTAELQNNLSNAIQQSNELNLTVSNVQLLSNSMNPNHADYNAKLNELAMLTGVLNYQAQGVSNLTAGLAAGRAGLTEIISNSSSEVSGVLSEFTTQVGISSNNLTSSIMDVSTLLAATSALDSNSVGVITDMNAAINVINQTTASINNIVSIANNVVQTADTVRNIARNLSKIKSKLSSKRKPQKKLPNLPPSIDPKNSSYFTAYASLNTSIDSINTTITMLQSIPKIPFLS